MEKSKYDSFKGQKNSSAKAHQGDKELLTAEQMLERLKKEEPKNLVAAIRQYLSDEK